MIDLRLYMIMNHDSWDTESYKIYMTCHDQTLTIIAIFTEQQCIINKSQNNGLYTILPN